MKNIATLLAFLVFTMNVFAGAPLGVSGQSQTSNLYPSVIQTPNNLVTNLGSGKALFESGNKNILVNPSFEAGDSGWTNNGAEVGVVETSQVIDGKKSLAFTPSSETINLVQTSTLYASQFNGAVQGLASVRIRGGASVKVCTVVNSVVSTTNCLDTKTDAKWGLYKLPFIMGATNNGISITATSASGTIYVDDAFVGAQDLKVESAALNKQSSLIVQSATFGLATITGALTTSNGSGLYSYNSSTGIYTVLKKSSYTVSASLNNAGAGATEAAINFNGSFHGIGTSPAVASQRSHASASFEALPGQTFYVTNNAGNNTSIQWISVVGTESVSNSTYTSINADTNPVPFTPTGSWTTNTTYTGSWYRQGQFAYITYAVTTTGAPNAASLTLNIPSEIGTVDLTKEVYILRGHGTVTDYAIMDYDIIATTNNATSIGLVSRRSNTGTNPVPVVISQPISNIYPFTFGSQDFVKITVQVPIVGWTQSNLIIGQFNGLESCKDTYECTDTFTAQISDTGVVTNENVDWINGNCVVTTVNTFTCTYRGGLSGNSNNLTVPMNCNVTGTSAAAAYKPIILSSTTTAFQGYTYIDNTGSASARPFAVSCQKGTGDYLGKTAKAVASDQHFTKTEAKAVAFSVSRGSMPYPVGGTPYIFNSVQLDTESGYNTVAGQYTVKKARLYSCEALINLVHGSSTGAYMNIGFYINGVFGFPYNTERAVTGEGSRSIRLSANLYLSLNDLIDVRTQATNWTSISAMGDYSYFSCVRTGIPYP